MPFRWRSELMTAREASLRVEGALGATIGYGCLAAFLALLGLQFYRWFRSGEWTHVGVIDGLRDLFAYLGIPHSAIGRAANLSHWLDAPIDWLGLHRVLDALPASLALFALSVLGNSIYIYTSDRLREPKRV